MSNKNALLLYLILQSFIHEGMIRGTSHDQDSRFKDKAQKMLLQSKWPDKYDIKIDLAKVDFQALREWIEKRTTELLGAEDDIVSGTVISLLEEAVSKSEKPNAKKIHVAMSGFLTTHTLTFISELWDWLDEAQKSKSGISKKMLDERKEEELKRKQKLKDVNDKKSKIKNYKFDVIKNHVGRQREPSVEAKRKERNDDRENSYEKGRDRDRRRRRRSQSRDKRKRNRSYSKQSNNQKDDRRYADQQRRQDRRKKSKYRRSYSRSRSPDSQVSKSRSRSKQRDRRPTRKVSSVSRSQSQSPRNKKPERRRTQKQTEHRGRKKSISRSESSSVVSSSNNQS